MSVRFDAEERSIRLTFGKAVRALRAGLDSDDVMDAITAGSVRRVLRAAPIDAFRDTLAGASDAIRSAVMKAAVDASNPDTATVAMRFDRTDPRALAWAEENVGIMVKRVGDQTRDAIRAAVTEAFRTEVDPRVTFRKIEQVVGLHSRDAQAALNIAKTTRDRLIENGATPADAQRAGDAAAGKYRAKALRRRAEMIGRTETQFAQTRGRRLAWEQMDERGLVDLDVYGQRWSAAAGACLICSDLDGTIVAASEGFGALDGPPAHPMCRCSVSLIPPGYPGWR